MNSIIYKDIEYPVKNLTVRYAPTSNEYPYDQNSHCYPIAPESLFDAMCGDDETLKGDDEEEIDSFIHYYVDDNIFYNKSDQEIALEYLDEPYILVTDVIGDEDIKDVASTLKVEVTYDLILYVMSEYESVQRNDPTGNIPIWIEDAIYNYQTLNKHNNENK